MVDVLEPQITRSFERGALRLTKDRDMAIDRLVRSVGDNSGVEIALRAYKLGAESLNGI